MKRAMLTAGAGAMLLSIAASAQAEQFGTMPLRRPFTETLSNTTPLAFGRLVQMSAKRSLGRSNARESSRGFTFPYSTRLLCRAVSYNSC